ncbi:uncharacterized protein LOC118407179 [Branchiostoma floridae]|uniref:Uncharacterized protein LOC118407179 n=1 Tax=Branchiostoma floridae TaxID=7739 RepID=A0A9J7HSY4_BRAFL|nr:uncharacterized protein LOC118407179 [Branchiostoma floridae]
MPKKKRKITEDMPKRQFTDLNHLLIHVTLQEYMSTIKNSEGPLPVNIFKDQIVLHSMPKDENHKIPWETKFDSFYKQINSTKILDNKQFDNIHNITLLHIIRNLMIKMIFLKCLPSTENDIEFNNILGAMISEHYIDITRNLFKLYIIFSVMNGYIENTGPSDIFCDLFTVVFCIFFPDIIKLTPVLESKEQPVSVIDKMSEMKTTNVTLKKAINLVFKESNLMKHIFPDTCTRKFYQLSMKAADVQKNDNSKEIHLFIPEILEILVQFKEKILTLESREDNFYVNFKRATQSNILKHLFNTNFVSAKTSPKSKSKSRRDAVAFVLPTKDSVHQLLKEINVGIDSVTNTKLHVYVYICKLSGWNVYFTWPQHTDGGDSKPAADKLAQDLQRLPGQNLVVILLLRGVSKISTIKPGNVVPIMTVTTTNDNSCHENLLLPKWPLLDNSHCSFVEACAAEINDPKIQVAVTEPSDCCICDASEFQSAKRANPGKVIAQGLPLFAALRDSCSNLGVIVGVAKSLHDGDTSPVLLTLCNFVREMCVRNPSKVLASAKCSKGRSPKSRQVLPSVPQTPQPNSYRPGEEEDKQVPRI